MDGELDIGNFAMVCVMGGRVVMLNPPKSMTPDQALVLAAYLVALSEHKASVPFADVLTRVCNT